MIDFIKSCLKLPYVWSLLLQRTLHIVEDKSSTALSVILEEKYGWANSLYTFFRLCTIQTIRTLKKSLSLNIPSIVLTACRAIDIRKPNMLPLISSSITMSFGNVADWVYLKTCTRCQCCLFVRVLEMRKKRQCRDVASLSSMKGIMNFFRERGGGKKLFSKKNIRREAKVAVGDLVPSSPLLPPSCANAPWNSNNALENTKRQWLLLQTQDEHKHNELKNFLT